MRAIRYLNVILNCFYMMFTEVLVQFTKSLHPGNCMFVHLLTIIVSIRGRKHMFFTYNSSPFGSEQQTRMFHYSNDFFSEVRIPYLMCHARTGPKMFQIVQYVFPKITFYHLFVKLTLFICIILHE